MRKLLVEFIGTFFLVLVIALTGNPLAIGAILIAMIYMGGYISGAQYNPAVTVAVFIRKKIDLTTALQYMAVQVLAGALAAIIFFGIKGTTFTPQPGSDFFIALLTEIVFTFALASVVLHTATSELVEGNHYYGAAIGLMVMAGAFAAGPISGGVFNPAVAIGPIFLDAQHMSTNFPHLLIYLLGPLTGGALAGAAYNYLVADHPQIEETDESDPTSVV